MDLVLHQSRRDRDQRKKLRQFIHIPVGKAQGPDLSLLHIGLHGFVCLHIIRSGMVEEHHVDVADIQLFQRRINCSFRIIKLTWIYLCDHKDFFTRNAIFFHRLPDAFPDGFLIVIHIGRIDEPSAVFEQRFHRIHASIVIQCICAESHDRHSIAAVQKDRMILKVKSSDRFHGSRAFLQGEDHCRISVTHRGADLLRRHPLYFAEAGETPGILIIVDRDLVSLIKDHISRLRRDALIIRRKLRSQRTDFLKSAVIVHVNRDVSVLQQLHKCLCRRIAFRSDRKDAVPDVCVDHSFFIRDMF